MIVGLGLDIVEKTRVERLYSRYPEAFLRHILHPLEFPLFEKRTLHRRVEFLAGRFAAKEAYMKAVGMGMRAGFPSIAVLNEVSGKPRIEAPHHPVDFVVHVTITHEVHLAMAQVIIESRN